jgi:hypothetical protein
MLFKHQLSPRCLTGKEVRNQDVVNGSSSTMRSTSQERMSCSPFLTTLLLSILSTAWQTSLPRCSVDGASRRMRGRSESENTCGRCGLVVGLLRGVAGQGFPAARTNVHAGTGLPVMSDHEERIRSREAKASERNGKKQRDESGCVGLSATLPDAWTLLVRPRCRSG